MKIPIFLLLFLCPYVAFSFIEVSFNGFSTIFNFKPGEAFGTSATYIHKGQEKSTWDVGGAGFYFTLAANIYGWIKPGLFFSRAALDEKIDSFNSYANPQYQISHYEYGADLRIFPFGRYFFVRLGYIEGWSTHQLKTQEGGGVALFDFSGSGYQAGFGVDIDFEKACFSHNCGIQIEYLVRKAWAKSMNIKHPDIVYDDTEKTSYREVMIGLGVYWFY